LERGTVSAKTGAHMVCVIALGFFLVSTNPTKPLLEFQRTIVPVAEVRGSTWFEQVWVDDQGAVRSLPGGPKLGKFHQSVPFKTFVDGDLRGTSLLLEAPKFRKLQELIAQADQVDSVVRFEAPTDLDPNWRLLSYAVEEIYVWNKNERRILIHRQRVEPRKKTLFFELLDA
jgi:hypothetical protein